MYILESSGGKNDGCQRDGLGYNGYGYNQHSRAFTCYDSKARVRGYVVEWFDKRLNAGFTLNQALCMYNRGQKLNSCEYAIKFKSL